MISRSRHSRRSEAGDGHPASGLNIDPTAANDSLHTLSWGDSHMRTLVLSCTALTLILAGVRVRAEDAEAKKVVEAAIKAQGGAEAIAKYKDKAVTTKGKIKLFQPIEAE